MALIAVSVLACGACSIPVAARAASVPAGFDDQLIADLNAATDVTFTPDGRILIATKTGQVRVYQNGALLLQRALDLGALGRICLEGERGLSGIAVDPAFADQHFVYLYYTYRGDGTCGETPDTAPVNRVSRFVLDDDNRIDPARETVLVDGIAAPSINHMGGDLAFGKDGYLYVTVGDGGCDATGLSGCGPQNEAARHPNLLNGKILRIGSNGEVPASNPFTGPGTARCNATGNAPPGTWCQEIFALGLRNPFRFAFDPNSPATRFFINDVGADTWEEVDVGGAGADYGWNVREGPCAAGSTTDCGLPPVGMTNPIYAYDHSGGCASITGSAFVPDGAWPVQYQGSYVFADFVCGKLFVRTPDGAVSEFASGLTSPVAVDFAPNGFSKALYYTTWAAPRGLHRISYVGSANRAPHAEASAAPTSGDVPLDVHFDGSASGDPDSDALTYTWDFGDGSPISSAAAPVHRYAKAGTYTAVLVVSDGRGGRDAAEIRIDAGNHAPVPRITSPAPDKRFSVGEDITLSGSATDREDGELDAARLTWEVVKHHATHVHPFLDPTSGSPLHVTAPQPEDLSGTTNTYLELRLTATDSRGLSTTVSQILQPLLVRLDFATDPSGLRVEVNGTAVGSSIFSWAGWRLDLRAPTPQFDSAGVPQRFVSWSDGGAAAHAITSPFTDADYLATFAATFVRPRGAALVFASLVPADVACFSPNRRHGGAIASGSCSPATAASSSVELGTPDANGAPAGGTASMRFAACPTGSCTTPDIAIDVSTTDVRCGLQSTACGKSNMAGKRDYGGELEGRATVRITDAASGTGEGEAATMTDYALKIPISCAPTASRGEGSICAVSTTVNTLVSGAVRNGDRALWEVGQLQVLDGGPDGARVTAPNQLFLVQGLFLP